MRKNRNIILLIFGSSFIVIGLTIGQILEPILYIMIPLGLVFLGGVFVTIISERRKKENK